MTRLTGQSLVDGPAAAYPAWMIRSCSFLRLLVVTLPLAAGCHSWADISTACSSFRFLLTCE